MRELSAVARRYFEKLLADPHRPKYHFAMPFGNAYPGDPNGAFFADGRYHLMYLYRNELTEAYHWGHLSSSDLLHWYQHPDALTVDDGDQGCFSGGAFLDDDGTAYLSFWKFPSKDHRADHGGIALASSRPPYDKWERVLPIAIESDARNWGIAETTAPDGSSIRLACADPSNIWKQDGYYYMQTGNKCVLDTYGRGESADPYYTGDWVDLFRSKDLKTWEYRHRFYENPHTDSTWPDETEDDMCPSFLPLPDKKSGGTLTDRYLQLFISHNKGGQYYVGTLNGEHFIPEQHGRCSWLDKACFAPEALIDDKNRQLAWFWLVDNRHNEISQYGWSGVYSFPRAYWLENDVLHMAPAEELDQLQCHPQNFSVGTLDGMQVLPVQNGESFRLKATVDLKNASFAGFRVRVNADGSEYTDIRFDREKNQLIYDTSHSGSTSMEEWIPTHGDAAPFTLTDGELLSFDLFVDHSVVEVYLNERQAICRRVYPTKPAESLTVSALSDGADFVSVTAYEIQPTNLF